MKIREVLNRILDTAVFLLTGKGALAKEAVDCDLCDFSGQGRDRYGR